MFDYRLEDGGISSTTDDEDDDEGKQVTADLPREGRHREGPTGWWLSSSMNSDCREEAALMVTGLRLGLFASSPESSQTHRVVIIVPISQTRKLRLRTIAPS